MPATFYHVLPTVNHERALFEVLFPGTAAGYPGTAR